VSVLLFALVLPPAVTETAAEALSFFCFLSNALPLDDSLTLTAPLLPASTVNVAVPSVTVVVLILPLTFVLTLTVSVILPVHVAPPTGQAMLRPTVAPLLSTSGSAAW